MMPSALEHTRHERRWRPAGPHLAERGAEPGLRFRDFLFELGSRVPAATGMPRNLSPIDDIAVEAEQGRLEVRCEPDEATVRGADRLTGAVMAVRSNQRCAIPNVEVEQAGANELTIAVRDVSGGWRRLSRRSLFLAFHWGGSSRCRSPITVMIRCGRSRSLAHSGSGTW